MPKPADRLVFSTGEPAYAVDRQGIIVAWNRSAEAALGYSRQEALGQACWCLLQGEDLFGNRYCGEHCPHREMASRGEAIRPSRIRLRTVTGLRREFTVRTLAFGGQSAAEFLLHLCRPEPDGVKEGQSSIARQPGKRPVLTHREQQVLDCLHEGLSTRQMARTLSISVATVRNHIENILAKLKVHSRLEAVAAARRLGLL